MARLRRAIDREGEIWLLMLILSLWASAPFPLLWPLFFLRLLVLQYWLRAERTYYQLRWRRWCRRYSRRRARQAIHQYMSHWD